MRPPLFQAGRRFSFELTVEITDTLCLTAGDMSELLLDGLLALDEEGILFPGVTVPGNGDRLLDVGIKLVGYARPAGLGNGNDAYRALMAAPSRKADKESLEIGERLRGAAAQMHASVLRQRMLIARLRALGGDVGTPATADDVDRAVAEGLIAAAEAVTASADAALTTIM